MPVSAASRVLCLSRFRSRSATALALLTSGLAAARASADGPLCLPDRNGDGHPLFGNPSVRTTPELTVGDVNAVAVADLDHDGDVDAVVAHSNNPFVVPTSVMSVLLNDGDGVSTVQGVYQTAADANHIALADLNGDGHVDAAVTCGFNDERVFVLLGTGAGTFAVPNALPVGKAPTCVRAADVDCDGDLDLITLNQGSKDVSMLRNEGSAVFASEVRFPSGSVPNPPYGFWWQPGPHLDVGDLDGDGDGDLAIPNTNKVFLLLNDGAGNFTPAAKHLATGAFVYVVAVGDLNNDARLDIAASTWMPYPDDRSLSVFLNSTELTVDPPVLAFDPPSLYPFVSGYESVYLTSLSIGDVTGDGYAEIVAAPGYLYEGASLYHNQGDGTFAPTRYEVSDAPRFIPFIQDSYFAALADVNGDGWLDLNVVSPSSRSTLRTVLNDGAGNLLNDYRSPHALASFCQGEECFQYWSDLDTGDVDGDGDVDIVVAQSHKDHSSQVKVLLNDGSGKFPRIDSYVLEPLTDYGGNRIVLGDLNGDGALDITLADSQFDKPGAVWTFFNNGDGTFGHKSKHALADLSPHRIGLGDINRDGHLDVVLWTSQPYAGDPNAALERRLLVLANDGAGRFMELTQTPFAWAPWLGAAGLALSDFDGDGDLDAIVSAGPKNLPSTLVLLRNDGAGGFRVAWTKLADAYLGHLVARDFDDDGEPDLFASAFHPETFLYAQVWRNDGTRFVKLHDLYDRQKDGPTCMAVGDFDDDGRFDFAGGSGLGAIGINLGLSPTSSTVYYGTDAWPSALAVADFDGDGREDLAATSELYGHVSIMLNRSCPRPPPCNHRPASP